MSAPLFLRPDHLLAASILCAAAAVPNHASAAVKLCTFPGSPSAALDRQVSTDVFAAAGVPVTIVAGGIGDSDDDDGVSLKELHHVLGRDCDVIAGFPRSSVADASGHDLIFSRGYLKSGYVDVRLSSAQGGNSSNGSQTSNGNVVAAMYASPAQLIALQQPGVKLDLRNTSASTVDAVASGEAQRAVVWYPAVVAWGLAHPSQRFRVAPAASPYADWHLVFAFPAKSAALRKRVDDALNKLDANGRLAGLTKLWTLPDSTVSMLPRAAHSGFRTAGWSPFADGRARIMPAVATSMSAGSMIRVADSAGPEAPSFDRTQADHGKGLYASSCAKCHGAALQGITAPALKGPAFAPVSNSHLTIGGIYGYMSTNMPADKPGKLKDQDYADIMAFLLYSNGYAPGSAKLTADSARTSTTPLNAGTSH